MACASLTGITYQCLSSLGGIKNIYIVDANSVTSSTVSNGVVTAISLSGGDTFKTFQFETRKSTSTFTEEATVTRENGTIFYTQTVQLNIPYREASKRNKLLVLAQAESLAVIIKDNNDKYWFGGYELGMYLSANVSESGIAKTDYNGYKVTLLGEEPALAYEVDSTIIAAIVS